MFGECVWVSKINDEVFEGFDEDDDEESGWGGKLFMWIFLVNVDVVVIVE